MRDTGAKKNMAGFFSGHAMIPKQRFSASDRNR
jgi:hypothetical protein